MKNRVALWSALALVVASFVVTGGAATASNSVNTVTSSSLGVFSPTFVGPAATGCNTPGCSLLSGPFDSPSTASLPTSPSAPIAPTSGQTLTTAALRTSGFHSLPNPTVLRHGPDPTPPTVNCRLERSGCFQVSNNPGGAVGVKGLNAVDSGSLSTNPNGDIEPSDQGLCAGNGYVVESNNLGEMLVFNTALARVSSVIPLDTVMGLANMGTSGWSSGGDVSCVYDPSNGGHWFISQFVSASSEASGGPFGGCFIGVPNTCYEGIAVTDGSNPFGPYHVYFLNANYNPAEPGTPTLLNDFAKTSVTQDAFLLFYDAFALAGNGIGGGGFNGAQEFAFNKNAMELGLPVTKHDGQPNTNFSVAIENMGLLATPDGTCASDNLHHAPSTTCWYSVIPAQPADGNQFDNSHGGSGFMLSTLDFYGSGDTRIAAFDWTGLSNLNSPHCATCSGIHFGGQLFSGVQYYYGEGFVADQKAGPTPLGDMCVAAGLSTTGPCPEGGIATNGDNFTQAAQSHGQLYGAVSTAVTQNFGGSSPPEVHQGAAYWVVGTKSFDSTGSFSLTRQGYVSAAHEDLEFPSMAVLGSGGSDGPSGNLDGGGDSGGGGSGAIMDFTLSGNGGPTGAHHGGYYPSSAYVRLGGSPDSPSTINVVDMGQAPQDGFLEYLGYPGPVQPRWGDYSAAVYLPGSNRLYFANGYVQSPNCTGAAFTLTIGTCGGTRDGYANWGTSVNYVNP